MEERLTKLEKIFEETIHDKEKIKNYVLGSVKVQLEEWLHDTLTISCITEEIERRYKRTLSDMAEYNNQHKKLERELEKNKEKSQENFEDICKIRNYLDDIVTDLKLKAYEGDLKRLQRNVDTKCSWDFAHDLNEKIIPLASTKELQELQQHLENYKKTVNQDYLLKEESSLAHEKILKRVEGQISYLSSKEDTRMMSLKINKRIDDVILSMEELKNFGIAAREETKKEILKVRADFSDSVKQFQYERLRKDVETRATKVELEQFLGEHIPKITEFNIEFRKIKQAIEAQEKAMVRLDEILLDKASKMDLIKFKDSMSQLPLAHQLERVKNLAASVTDHEEKIEEIKGDIENLLKFASDSGPNKINLETEVKILKHQMCEVENKISCKAEITAMYENLEKKASWEDFSHLAESIEAVHMQTKMLASQVSLIIPHIKNNRASSHTKITKKIIDIVINSKPTLDDFPNHPLKTMIRFPQTPEILKSRVSTPNKKFFNPLVTLNV